MSNVEHTPDPTTDCPRRTPWCARHDHELNFCWSVDVPHNGMTLNLCNGTTTGEPKILGLDDQGATLDPAEAESLQSALATLRALAALPTAPDTANTRPGRVDVAEQFAWEAPPLRPIDNPAGPSNQFTTPCPPWCFGDDGTGENKHDHYAHLDGVPTHQSRPLNVRQDAVRGYFDDHAGDVVRAGHLAVSLVQPDRAATPRVQIVTHWGKSTDQGVVERKFRLSDLYLDEVRELMSVLSHLLKVAQEVAQ